MSSVSRFLKQIPTDSQYFMPLINGTPIHLNVFNADTANATSSYVSGAAAGYFSSSNVTPLTLDASGTLSLFRDMGKTLVSSGRTFRRVQFLVLSTPSSVIWQASNEGVTGSPSTLLTQDSSFGVFYFETGARGLGVAQGLVRYG